MDTKVLLYAVKCLISNQKSHGWKNCWPEIFQKACNCHNSCQCMLTSMFAMKLLHYMYMQLCMVAKDNKWHANSWSVPYFFPCWLHRFLPVHWHQTMIIVCQSLGSRPILVLEFFTLVPRLFGTNSRCLFVQLVQSLPSRNIWRHISLIWPFSHRYRHSPWPVDVTELFPRFCCWTLICLLHHWPWLRQRYWRYRTLIDWLIEMFFLWPDSVVRSEGPL